MGTLSYGIDAVSSSLRPPSHLPPTADVVARLAEIVGPAHALTDPGDQQAYLREWRDKYVGTTPLVLRPGSTQEVSRILRLANEAGVAVVPQAGNTGLVGGQIPFGHEIVVSVGRLRRVREVDAAGGSMVVEAGLTLAEVQAEAEKVGRLFPLSLASEGSCQIGGNLASNAGGVGVLAYGNARSLALGLEVVLADGRVWEGLRTLKKDNTGYDLRDLFIGSEGTLGIITAAALKLHPALAGKATALAAVHHLPGMLELFRLCEQGAGGNLTAFEFMDRRAIEFVLRHVSGTRDPFVAAHPWYALLELSGQRADDATEAKLEALLSQAAERGLIGDAVLAGSLAQAKELWRLRENVSEAQKPEGGSIKHDISVPIPRIPEFIDRANTLVESLCPGARPVPFGHFGDGNVHYNISQPSTMDESAFLALWETISAEVHALVAGMGGSISAEHGIGRMKREELARTKSPVELAMMRAIKSALDPKGILNPGKVL